MYDESRVLCGANSYDKKFYINERFKNLPEQVKQELQIMCVMFTEEVGGILGRWIFTAYNRCGRGRHPLR